MTTTTRNPGSNKNGASKSGAKRRPEVEVIGNEVDPRIAARREKVAGERRRFWRRGWFKALLVLVILVALGGVVDVALYSRLFEVKMIDVLGADHLDVATIAESAGVHEGEAMISVDPAATARKLHRNPWIERATVTRHWPGVVEIRVDERRPTAVMVDGSPRSLAISTSGVVLGSRYDLGDTRADRAVRTVRVDTLPSIEPGTALAEPMRSAVEVAGAVPASVIALEVPATLSTDGQLSFTVGKGQVVKFGDADEAAEKFLAISTMLSGSVDMTGYCVLDVRIPLSPKVVRRPYC